MRSEKTLASVTTLFALVLAACGGGGGGGTAPAPGAASEGTAGAASAPAAASNPASAPAPGPATTPPAASGPAALPPAAGPASPAPPPAAGGGTSNGAQFAAFGPLAVASSVAFASIGASTAGPKAARLAQGGAVIAWTQAGALIAQLIDAAGGPVGPQLAVASQATIFSVAGTSNGEWVIAWSASSGPAAATVQMRRYSASGALLQDTTSVTTAPAAAIDAGLDVAAAPDGGHAVAWSAQSTAAGPRQILVQRFSANGAAVGSAPTVANETQGDQAQPRIVPLADGSLVLTWLQTQGDAALGGLSFTITTRPFSGLTAPLAAARGVAASAAAATFPFAAAPLADGRVGLAWGQPASTSSSSPQARWQIVDAQGNPESVIGGITVLQIDSVAIARADRGFTAFFQTVIGERRGTTASINSIAVNNDAVAAATVLTQEVDRTLNLVVSPTLGIFTGPAAPGFAVAGGSDGRYVLTYASATANGADVIALGK